MAKYKGNFRCTVLSPKKLLFEGEVMSVFVQGDRGEYELLAYHYPLIGILKRGEIVIDGDKAIPVTSGIVRFFANECTVLVEESLKPAVKTP